MLDLYKSLNMHTSFKNGISKFFSWTATLEIFVSILYEALITSSTLTKYSELRDPLRHYGFMESHRRY
jgi:hypothetical protein